MGLSPAEVNRLSVFQYMAALEGFIEANSHDSEKALSEAEKDALWDFIQS